MNIMYIIFYISQETAFHFIFIFIFEKPFPGLTFILGYIHGFIYTDLNNKKI